MKRAAIASTFARASAVLSLALSLAADLPAWANGRSPVRPAPACGSAEALSTPPGPRPEDDFGCATELNLRLMAADPRDLERGRAASPAPADQAIDAVRRLRSGQVKALTGTSPADGAASASANTSEAGR